MFGKKSPKFDRLPADNPVLEGRNLAFQIAGKVILHEVNVQFHRGEMNFLIGANGVGKSTLMRLLSGYLPLNQGEIRLNRQRLTDYRPLELAQYRAVMQQHSQINFPFSAEEVIRMGRYHRTTAPGDFQQVVDATECQTLLAQPYRRLSGGEQQRVQLARALFQLWQADMSGKLLFLDEPTSAFDLHYQQRCLRLLRDLCDTRGLTLCAILHDLNLAALYGDRIILLADRQIQAQGSPHTVITQENISRWYRSEGKIVPHFEQPVPQVMLCR